MTKPSPTSGPKVIHLNLQQSADDRAYCTLYMIHIKQYNLPFECSIVWSKSAHMFVANFRCFKEFPTNKLIWKASTDMYMVRCYVTHENFLRIEDAVVWINERFETFIPLYENRPDSTIFQINMQLYYYGKNHFSKKTLINGEATFWG